MALALAVLKRATSVVTAKAKQANNGEVPKLKADTYPLDFALRVNGELKDLATVVTETDAVEPVLVDSPERVGPVISKFLREGIKAVRAIDAKKAEATKKAEEESK